MDRPDVTSIATTSGENDPLSGSLSSCSPGTCIDDNDGNRSSYRVTSTLRQHAKSVLIALSLLLLLVLGVVGIVIGLERETAAATAPARDESNQGVEQEGASNENAGLHPFSPTGDLGLVCQAGSKLLELHSTAKSPYKTRTQQGTNYTWKLVDCANQVVAQCKRPCDDITSTKLRSTTDQHFHCLPDGQSFTLEVHVDTKQSCCGFEMGHFALEYNDVVHSRLTQITRSSIKIDDFVEGRDEDPSVWSIEIGKQVNPCLMAEPTQASSPIVSRVPTKSLTPVNGPSENPSQPPPGHPPGKSAPPSTRVEITGTLSVPASTSAPSKVSSAPPSQIPTKIPSTAPTRGPPQPPSSLPLSGEPNVISCPEAGNSIDIGSTGSSITIFNAGPQSFCGIFISSASGDLVSFARSYNEYNWEASPGPKASRMDSILCTSLSCTIKLPELEIGSSYVVLAKDGSMSIPRQVARFLEMVTFGVTKPELAKLNNSGWGEEARAEYVREQLDMPPTSHREHFRRRTNTKWPADKQSASSDHPCSPLSKWRRYTFTEADKADVFDDTPNSFVLESVAGNTYREIYQADSERDVGCGECMDFHQINITRVSYQGYTVGGFGDYLVWNIDMAEGGVYPLSFHYSIGRGDTDRNRVLRLQVNGRTIRKRFRFSNTKNNLSYSEHIDAQLNAGNNSIRLYAETQGSGPFIDHLQIGKPPAVIIKSNGYARTVVKEGFAEMTSPSITVTLAKLPSPPRGQYDKGSLAVSIEGSDGGVSLDAGNPPIDFSGHEHLLLPQGYFSFDSTHTFLNTTSELYGLPPPFGQEYLLRDGLEDPLCDSIPLTSSQRSPPVFGQLSDGTWLQWTPSLQLEANGPTIDAIDKSESTLSDGGGQIAADSLSVKCSNVPRTFFNEATCRLSYENSTCMPAENNLIDLRIHLTEENIISLNDISSRFVYAVRGIRLDSIELHPCVTKRSRWLVTESSTCPSPTPITTKTRDALSKAIGRGAGRHLNIRDAIRRIFMFCSDEDISLTTLEMQIEIEGDCFTHTHPSNYDVYDFSEWAKRHPGGREAIAQFAAIGSAWLDFPVSHPMSRWEKLGGGTIAHVGTHDSKLDFKDLPSELKTSAVVAEFGEEETGRRQAIGPTVVCGSTSEVKNDPILGEAYEFVSTGEATSKESELRAQKSNVWINAAVFAKDQLRQRVAHALSTIMPSVPSDLQGGSTTEKYTVFHDIFVRHAFGRYIDVLRDISYSPIMGQQLSFKDSKSRAYTYQKKRQLADADENFSREVMQLFSIGLVRLDDYGLPILDPETGQPLKTYTNEVIESLARSWTAFDMSAARGNVEGRSDSISSVDPMVIQPEWRDAFPKIGVVDNGYIGDKYVLCTEEPPRMFLKKGARYLLLGGSPLPHLLSDPAEVANEDVFAELEPNSQLFKALQNGGNQTSVELLTDLECTGIECMVDLLRVVKVGSMYFEWVPRPCTMLAFYNGKQVQTSDSSRRGQICANPDLPVAREACCRPEMREDVKQAKMVSGVTHLYEGERMTWARAHDRCRAYGSSLCQFASLKVSPHDAKFRKGFHWTDQDECNILVKVDRDGRIAIVHDVRGASDVVLLHLDLDHTTNFFHVFWDESSNYPGASEENSCSIYKCLPLQDGTCLCRTEIKEKAVFDSVLGITRDDIMSKLFIGTASPETGSSSTYERDVIAHLVEGRVDEKTVFELRNKEGEPIFLRNLVSSVSVAGWLMPPKKLEAEDATLFDTDVKTSITASGGAFTEFRSSVAYIEWAVDVPLNAQYSVSFNYALNSDPRDISLLVNGQSTVLRFLPTGSWERHFLSSAPTACFLKAGINSIRLQPMERTSGVNIDLLRIEAKEDSNTAVAMPSFRNPPHFLSLLSDGTSKSELTRRDAQYETEAVLEHLFYHDNVAPFICGRMIQRFGISNPSPRYVKVCVDAFRSGSYESGSIEFGSGRYGCLEALISSIVLDREATDPAASFDSSFGSIREPLLRYIQLFRSMEYKSSFPVSSKIDSSFPGDFQIRLANLPPKIGQGPHDHPSIFSFFLPAYIPGSGPLATSMLHSPESLMLTGPNTLQLLSGMHSLIKFGLSDCDGGFGLNPNVGSCRSSRGSYSGRLYYEPDGSSLLEKARDLSLVLAAGRVNEMNLSKIVSACSAEPDVAQLICLQQLVVSTAEFHTNTETTPIMRENNEKRKVDRESLRSNLAYKAIIVLDLKGGADSFNLLAPLTCAPIDVYENYRSIRGKTADEEGVGMPRSRLLEISANADQPCESFGVHENLPILKELYEKGEATFIANAGLLLKPTNNDSHRIDTPVNLFSHNDMSHEMKKEDVRNQHTGTGVAGRIATALTEAGIISESISVDGQQVMFSTAGRGPPQVTIGEDGLPDFNEGEESIPNEVLLSLNGPVTPSSGQFAHTWSTNMNEAISQYEKLKILIDGAVSTEIFPTTRISAQLELVTKLMQSHQLRGAQRDIFYVSQPRYDTHQNVDERLVDNFSELNGALEAFVAETKVLGLYKSMVLLQFSEFGRTLTPNTSSGTDHAWGGNYFLIGGALNGGKVLGHYPAEFERSESNKITLTRGRLVPTTPFDAVWMGTSEWFGVPSSQMEYVLPMHKNFPAGTLFSEEDLFRSEEVLPVSGHFQ